MKNAFGTNFRLLEVLKIDDNYYDDYDDEYDDNYDYDVFSSSQRIRSKYQFIELQAQ